MEKLPIKFFSPREEDNQRIEGGGSSEDPKWILEEKSLIEQARILSVQLDDLCSILDKKKSNISAIPLVAIVKIRTDATAKTKRSYINSLFENLDNIIGFDSDSNLLFKISSKDAIFDMKKRISHYFQCRYAISCIEKIFPFKPYIQNYNDFAQYKIKLIDFNNYEVNTNVQRLFECTIKKLNLEYTKTFYMTNMPIYKMKVSKDNMEKLIHEDTFDAIFSITPMPKYSPILDFVEEEKMEITPIFPEDGKEYDVIGILDNGIAKIPQIEPWLYDERWSPYPDSYLSADHGTFVAGVAIYGDILENKEWVGHRGVKVFDAAIFPDLSRESLDEDELISNIQRAISLKHNEIKIWSLSISLVGEVSDDRFSDFAIALDDLQTKYNILICKSAGNTLAPFSYKPKERINQGADSIRSLVVGSIAHKKSVYDFVEPGNPSPFSRVGPGPQFIIKPEVSHYGGNAGIDSSGKIMITGVKSFNIKGKIVTEVGTSFSTPRIASLAAGLSEELEESFDPLLIKSLIIHNAQYPLNLDVPEIERTKELGFGVPGPIRQILFNKNNEATLILRDSLSKGEMINILDFPMPDCLIKNNFYTGKIIVTLVYDPILSPTQGAEYCQSNIDILFGSYDEKELRDTTKKTILNPIGRKGAKNILNQSLYSKTLRKNNSDEFALRERLLIQYADKYYPVKKYAVDLTEMSESNKLRHLSSDKKWYLTIRGLFRDYIENYSKSTGEILSQEFCAIITIKGDENMHIYDNVTQKLDAYNFVYKNIKIANEIKIVD